MCNEKLALESFSDIQAEAAVGEERSKAGKQTEITSFMFEQKPIISESKLATQQKSKRGNDTDSDFMKIIADENIEQKEARKI